MEMQAALNTDNKWNSETYIWIKNSKFGIKYLNQIQKQNVQYKTY